MGRLATYSGHYKKNPPPPFDLHHPQHRTTQSFFTITHYITLGLSVQGFHQYTNHPSFPVPSQTYLTMKFTIFTAAAVMTVVSFADCQATVTNATSNRAPGGPNDCKLMKSLSSLESTVNSRQYMVPTQWYVKFFLLVREAKL